MSCWRLDKPLAHVVENQRGLAMSDPLSTSVADWADFAAHHPDVFAHDRVHFTDSALIARTAIVWATVRAAELRLAASGREPGR